MFPSNFRKRHNKSIRISKSRNDEGKYEVGWKRPSNNNDDYAIINLNTLLKIINLDFDHAHFKIGDLILTQKNGCPIGGFISAQLAIIYCCYAEHTFMSSRTPRLQHSIYGIRSTDDLLLIISYDPNDKPFHHRITHTILNNDSPRYTLPKTPMELQ